MPGCGGSNCPGSLSPARVIPSWSVVGGAGAAGIGGSGRRAPAPAPTEAGRSRAPGGGPRCRPGRRSPRSTGSGSGSGSGLGLGLGLLGRRGHVGRPRWDDHRARLGLRLRLGRGLGLVGHDDELVGHGLRLAGVRRRVDPAHPHQAAGDAEVARRRPRGRSTSIRMPVTPVSDRSTQVVAAEPSSSTVSASVVKLAPVRRPRMTTLVSVSISLTSTKPGSSRSPLEISASRTSSKPAPSSTSSQELADPRLLRGRQQHGGVLAEDAEPARRGGRTARLAGCVHGKAPSFCSRLSIWRAES